MTSELIDGFKIVPSADIPDAFCMVDLTGKIWATRTETRHLKTDAEKYRRAFRLGQLSLHQWIEKAIELLGTADPTHEYWRKEREQLISDLGGR